MSNGMLAISQITRDLVANSEPVPPQGVLWFFAILAMLIVVTILAAIVIANNLD